MNIEVPCVDELSSIKGVTHTPGNFLKTVSETASWSDI